MVEMYMHESHNYNCNKNSLTVGIAILFYISIKPLSQVLMNRDNNYSLFVIK